MVYADEEFYKNEYLLGRKAAISSGFPFYARQAARSWISIHSDG